MNYRTERLTILILSDYFEEFTKHWIPLVDIGQPSYENGERCEKMALAKKTIQ